MPIKTLKIEGKGWLTTQNLMIKNEQIWILATTQNRDFYLINFMTGYVRMYVSALHNIHQTMFF
jgi:hypothetical protein